MYWHRTISYRFTTNEWIWIRCCQRSVANKNLKFFDRSIRHFYIIPGRVFFSSSSSAFLRESVQNTWRNLSICSIENTVNRLNRFFFFLSSFQFNLDDEWIESSIYRKRCRQKQKKRKKCSRVSAPIFSSIFICVVRLLLLLPLLLHLFRDICILNYGVWHYRIEQGKNWTNIWLKVFACERED